VTAVFRLSFRKVTMPDTPAPQPETAAPPRRRIWPRVVAGGLIIAVGAAVVAWWNPALVVSVVRLVRGDDTDPGERQAVLEKIEAQERAPAANPVDRDAEYRRKMLGSWTQSRDDAERELYLYADGKALQVILPKGFLATSYLGDRVELDVKWTVENGRAIFESVGGRPADMAERINQMFGTYRNRRIVEINDDHILLFDEKDNSPSEWKRAAGTTSDPDAAGKPGAESQE
jgi:hypothetical protein